MTDTRTSEVGETTNTTDSGTVLKYCVAVDAQKTVTLFKIYFV
jgi:hypothetical protein